MKLSRFCVFIVGLSFFLSASTTKAEPAAKASQTLSYADRSQIEDLFYEYSYYIDNRAAEAFASTFTPDGKLEFPGTVVQGHDQLVAFGSRPATDKIRTHFVGDILLRQIAPGRVHARSMVILGIRDVRGDTSPTAFEGMGVYDDFLVKTPSGWRFVSRHGDKQIPLSSDFLPKVSGNSKALGIIEP